MLDHDWSTRLGLFLFLTVKKDNFCRCPLLLPARAFLFQYGVSHKDRLLGSTNLTVIDVLQTADAREKQLRIRRVFMQSRSMLQLDSIPSNMILTSTLVAPPMPPPVNKRPTPHMSATSLHINVENGWLQKSNPKSRTKSGMVIFCVR